MPRLYINYKINKLFILGACRIVHLMHLMHWLQYLGIIEIVVADTIVIGMIYRNEQ